jgi:GNAT superfamily N-acetyltransferase
VTPSIGALDKLLAEQGYREDARTSVQTLNLDGLAAPRTDCVTLSGELTDSWLDAYCRLNDVNPQHLPTMTRLLENIIPAHCFLTLQHGGEAAAVGLAVAEREYVGLFDIVTAAPLRRLGLGTELILHLLRWGKANGAQQGYLQVMCNNAPALRLYAKLGFAEIYQYWYRI